MTEPTGLRRVVIVGGEPATGKTTLMRQLAAVCGHGGPYTEGKVKYHTLGTWGVLLGDYSAERGTFGGTDALAMDAAPHAVKFLGALRHVPRITAAALEGDRLCSGKFVADLRQLQLEPVLVLLTATAEAKAARHHRRQDSQTAKFLAGRATKYRNLTPTADHVLANNTAQDMANNLDLLLSLLRP